MRKQLLAIACLMSAVSWAQQRDSIPGGGAARVSMSAGMPAGMGAGAAMRQGPRPFKEVITDKAVSKKGLFTVHKVEDKYYFEIPDSLMGREVLAVTRFSRIAGGGGKYGGEEVNTQSLKFEKGPSNNVFLRVVTLISTADSTTAISRAVKNSNLDPIGFAFGIAALSKDSSGVVVEVTDFFKGDNQIVSLDPNDKRQFNLTALLPDRSYIQSINTYPINIEIKTVKTYEIGRAHV